MKENIMSKRWGIFLIASLLLSLTSAPGQQPTLPCETQQLSLNDGRGNRVLLKAGELRKRAVLRIPPTFPLSCRCKGRIIVYVLVNAKGEVECVRTDEGHPLLRVAAANAARQWKFRPFHADEKTNTVLGCLEFNFSADGTVTY